MQANFDKFWIHKFLEWIGDEVLCEIFIEVLNNLWYSAQKSDARLFLGKVRILIFEDWVRCWAIVLDNSLDLEKQLKVSLLLFDLA